MSEVSNIVIGTAFSLASASFISFVIGYLKFRERIVIVEEHCKDTDLTGIKACVNELSNKLNVLTDRVTADEVKTNLWWNTVQNAMIDVLHHDDTPERDGYLDKLRNNTITMEDLSMLRVILEDIMKNNPKYEERAAAKFLYPDVIFRLTYDNKSVLCEI